MIKIDRTAVKKKIKHYTPELIAAASVVAGAVAIKYIINSINEMPDMPDAEGIVIVYDWLDKLNEVGGAYLLQTTKGDFLLTKSTI